MKLILMALTFFSLTAFAAKNEVIFPQVYNYNYSVDVQVWNTSNVQVTCSGTIFMTMQDNTSETYPYYDIVMARLFSMKTIYPRSASNSIKFVSHTILCF